MQPKKEYSLMIGATIIIRVKDARTRRSAKNHAYYGKMVSSFSEGHNDIRNGNSTKKYVLKGRTWLSYFQKQDCHKWIIALEHGSRSGTLAITLEAEELETKEQNSFFNQFKTIFSQKHISNLQKTGVIMKGKKVTLSQAMTAETIKIRFGVPRPLKKKY